MLPLSEQTHIPLGFCPGPLFRVLAVLYLHRFTTTLQRMRLPIFELSHLKVVIANCQCQSRRPLSPFLRIRLGRRRAHTNAQHVISPQYNIGLAWKKRRKNLDNKPSHIFRPLSYDTNEDREGRQESILLFVCSLFSSHYETLSGRSLLCRPLQADVAVCRTRRHGRQKGRP